MRGRGGEEGGFREMEDLASANIPGSEWTLEMPGWAQRCSNTRPPDGPAAHVGTQNQTYLPCITDSPRLLWRPDQVSNLNLDFYTCKNVLLLMAIFRFRTTNISVPREKMQ